MADFVGEGHTHRSDIIFGFAIVLAFCLAWLIRDVLLLLFVSALFAVVLKPVVDSVAKARIGRWHPFRRIAVLVLLLAMICAMVAFGELALPPVIRDLQEFSKEVPSRTPVMLEKLRSIPFADRIQPGELSARLQDAASSTASFLLVSLKDWAGKLFSILMGIILTVYFILEGDQAYRWMLSFFPPPSRTRLDHTLQRARVRMGKWLLGQGALMLILGVCSTVTFLLLHVRYAYALGALTGLLNIIPVIGAAISIALALLVAAIDSWGAVLGVAVFYLIYQQVENAYLTPRIMKTSVGLPGISILVALLIGSSLAGIVGAMISVPTAVLVTQLIDEYLVNKDPA